MSTIDCPGCGASNEGSADFCDRCFHPIDVPRPPLIPTPALAAAYPGGAVALPRLAPPPPPPPRRVALVDPWEPSPTNAVRPPIRWRWKHLWAFGFLAFGIPEAIARATSTGMGSLSSFLDTVLIFQLVGYVLAVGLAIHMVNREQNGDWTSLGISFEGDIKRDVTHGAFFGLGMLLAYLPVGLALSGGNFAIEGVVKVLVGSTSGAGLLLAALVVVVGAPIVEEIYYRGLLYEKLARRSRWVAIVVSTILFTAAHGALIIPAILLMGFGLAFMRRTRTLWFTMAAHASWNFVIIVLAATMMLGGANTFTASDGSYSFSHPRDWTRSTEIEESMLAGVVDVALVSPTQSFIGVTRVPAVGGSAQKTLSFLVDATGQAGLSIDLGTSPIERRGLASAGAAESFEVTFEVPGPGVTIRSHMVTVMPAGSQTVYALNMACPEPTCVDDEKAFDEVLSSLRFDI